MKSEFVSLRKSSDFGLVYERGKSFANRLFVMLVYSNNTSPGGRVGICVGKKTGNSVVRHRIRRLVRECFRLNWTGWGIHHDIVVIARTAAASCNYKEVESALAHLLRKHGYEINGVVR